MAAKATLALSGPEVRSSASAEPHVSGGVKEQRGPGLDWLPDWAELSPGEAVGLRARRAASKDSARYTQTLGLLRAWQVLP